MTVEENKKEFIELLSRVDRKGVEELVEFLNATDFFIAPASHRFNLAEDGGLCKHSLNVYHNLCGLAQAFDLEMNTDSLIITGLLHAIGKVNTYEKYTQNKYIDSKWVQVDGYRFKEANEKDLLLSAEPATTSAIMISHLIKLTDEETAAILNYQGNYMNPTTAEIYNRYPLAMLLHMADVATLYVDENPYRLDE